MARPRKPLPKNVEPKHAKDRSPSEARKTIVWELMLSGASNGYIQAALEKNSHAVSIKTIIQDKKELDAEAMETFASERVALTARKLAYLDRIARKLEATAQQAEAGIPDGTYWIEVRPTQGHSFSSLFLSLISTACGARPRKPPRNGGKRPFRFTFQRNPRKFL